MSLLSIAQSKLDVVSDTINITQSRFTTKQTVPLSPTKSLAQELQNNVQLNYKNYGPGSIANLSLRGTSASHTRVLWNNVPIENTMVGQMDMSLIPSYFMNSYTIQTNQNMDGFAMPIGIGGNLSLFSDIEQKNKKWSANSYTERGSFDHYAQGASIAYHNKHWTIKQGGFYQQARNNYPYNVEGTDSIAYINHNQINQAAALSQIKFEPNKKIQLQGDLWVQNSAREIPPTSVQARSLSTQEDQILRTVLNYKGIFNRWKIQQTVSYTNENIHYVDPINLVDNNSRFSRFNVNNNIKRFGRFFDIQWQQSLAILNADIEKYTQPVQEKRYVSTLGISKKWKGLDINIQTSKHYNNQRKLPFTGGVFVHYQTSPLWQVKLEYSHRIRQASLNDLYWAPGGNELLLPEQAKHAEISQTIFLTKQNFAITAYFKDVQDWILWYRPAQNFFWVPENIQSVQVKGLAFSYDLNLDLFKLNASYSYIESTFGTSLSSPNINQGDQIWYAPVHNFNFALEGDFHQFDYGINHLFKSESQGINQAIPAYHLSDIYLKYNYSLAKINTSIKLTCNNILDSSYEIIEYRPMPGRSYMVSINIDL